MEINLEPPEPRGEPAHCPLDEAGVRHKSDLSSLGRDHLRAWKPFLAPLRGQAFDVCR